MLDTASPLANIYSTSTMEHHHFNQTVTILQQNGHNIFSKLDGHEYKQVLSNIKHCILATDLVQFFPSQRQLANLVDQDLFSINDRQHRYLLQAMTMTASDLCASSKPWDIQAETVRRPRIGYCPVGRCSAHHVEYWIKRSRDYPNDVQ